MHDHTEVPTAEQVLAKMAQEMGGTPETMALLSKIKPSMVVEQARSKRFASEGSSIPDKYRQLIAIAAVAGSGTPSCLKVQIEQALRQGIEPIEIVDALVAARFALASTVFSNSLDGLRILVDSLGEVSADNA
ncbi:MAG: carboxymuconolactone decarboxylase family protein [Coriobacteriia bacterium]|nr:carboxymuconolactone decarboxylase family protein [Coriobacteriia bacterium]